MSSNAELKARHPRIDDPIEAINFALDFCIGNGASDSPAPNPLPGRRGWIVVALFVLVAFALAGHAMAMR